MNIKRAWFIVLFILCINVVCVAFPGLVHARETIRLIAFNYPPYYSKTYIENKGHGFILDLVTAAFDAADVEAVITFHPPLRSAQSFKEGKFAAYVGPKDAPLLLMDEKELDIINLCDYYLRFAYFKSHIKKDLTKATVKDLRGYRIGDINGSFYIENLGLTIDFTTDIEQGLKKLAHGRIDLWLSVGLTVNHLVETQFPERLNDLAFVEKPIANGTVDVTFLRSDSDHERIKNLFVKGLKIVRNNGTCEKILSRYFGDDVNREKMFETSLPSCE